MKDVNKDYKYDVESILYYFANKFLSGKDLERVKEKLKMTELGKSLPLINGDKKLLDGLQLEFIAGL